MRTARGQVVSISRVCCDAHGARAGGEHIGAGAAVRRVCCDAHGAWAGGEHIGAGAALRRRPAQHGHPVPPPPPPAPPLLIQPSRNADTPSPNPTPPCLKSGTRPARLGPARLPRAGPAAASAVIPPWPLSSRRHPSPPPCPGELPPAASPSAPLWQTSWVGGWGGGEGGYGSAMAARTRILDTARVSPPAPGPGALGRPRAFLDPHSSPPSPPTALFHTPVPCPFPSLLLPPPFSPP